MFKNILIFICITIFTPLVANAAEPEAMVTTDPFQKTTVPGFDESVDLYDESTWKDLSPEEKDELRAAQARLRNKSAVPLPQKILPIDDNELPPILAKPKRQKKLSNDQLWWSHRDNALRSATIGLGVTWAISTTATAIIWGIHVKNAKNCNNAINDIDDEQKFGKCINGGEQSLNLAVPGYISSSISGATFLGTIISGAMLGTHRNAKPFISASNNSAGIGLTGRF